MPDFINVWWDGLSFGLKFFYGIAILSAVLLLLQTVTMFFFGDSDGHGGDFSGADGADHHDTGVGMLSLKSITAFFTGFGWTAVGFMRMGLSMPVVIFLAGMVGVVMMFLIYLLMKSLVKLSDSGTMDYANAVGQPGTVYVTIPPAKGPGGQVETMIQGRLVTAEALQRGPEPLKPGTKVQVIEKVGASTLIVEPVENYFP
ncbi:NfeD family protein [Akkermansiaceae bacterium]|nr:NfeD family protein [Akkermansiaceae bacterium]